MKFLIITHVSHFCKDDDLMAYSPYVREMNLWLEYVEKVKIIAPVTGIEGSNIMLKYNHDQINLKEIPAFSLLGLKAILSTLKLLPSILYIIYEGMKRQIIFTYDALVTLDC